MVILLLIVYSFRTASKFQNCVDQYMQNEMKKMKGYVHYIYGSTYCGCKYSTLFARVRKT